ncbi:MAG: DNA polymerase III subunit epsilon [Rickettsiales bacterium]|nr:DNA polymerase III subunit epsilon [Rickettsiales bacterium]OUV76163.1 MAG: DNA polymerase III subunit epsilon [Rickettsiales bacterium TMED131]
MRSIALDIETTGLNPQEGHKIVEIGCVELINNFPTGKVWQKYINPQKSMPLEAFKVHGLSDEFLYDKQTFPEIAKEFLEFIDTANLIIHNAKFDLSFINHELEEINLSSIDSEKNKIIDTVLVARKIFPGQSVSLDALCKRYKVNTERKKHGALLDAELLTEVFLEMHGGRQQHINLDTENSRSKKENLSIESKYSRKVYKLTDEEIEKHSTLISYINNY